MFDAIFLSLASLAIPTGHYVPPEHEPVVLQPPATDWQNLHNDWLAIGGDLRNATSKVTQDAEA